VPAASARGDGGPVSQRTVVPSEGGEHDAALAWLMVVVKDIAGHEEILALRVSRDIRAPP